MDIQIINKYFQLTAIQEKQLKLAVDLYIDWNQKINVVSRKDIEQLNVRHVLWIRRPKTTLQKSSPGPK